MNEEFGGKKFLECSVRLEVHIKGILGQREPSEDTSFRNILITFHKVIFSDLPKGFN